MFNPGVIKGGEKSNIVSQHCDLDLEIRVPWGCSIPDLLEDIRAMPPTGQSPPGQRTSHRSPLPKCRLVSVTCDSVNEIYGGEVFPIIQWAASDARHLRRSRISGGRIWAGRDAVFACSERTRHHRLFKKGIIGLPEDHAGLCAATKQGIIEDQIPIDVSQEIIQKSLYVYFLIAQSFSNLYFLEHNFPTIIKILLIVFESQEPQRH